MFANRSAVVEAVAGHRVTTRPPVGGRRSSRKVPAGLRLLVTPGQTIEANEVIAATIDPVSGASLTCPQVLPEGQISHLLSSRERTLRFTGIKLARLRNEPAFRGPVVDLANDDDEDVYIRLEGLSYLTSVCGISPRDLFPPYLASPDPQIQLETVIALGEAGTSAAVELLSELLNDATRPYFLRSAAAWCLSRIGDANASKTLVNAFADVDPTIREEALEGIVTIGGPTLPFLLAGLREADDAVAAGCAEALRQRGGLSEEALVELTQELRSERPARWAVRLVGHLPRDQVAPAIASLQDSAPQLHYAISLLWSFVESWIARRWELRPGPAFPTSEGTEP